MQRHAPAALSSEMEAPTTYSWTLSGQQGAQSDSGPSIKHIFAMLSTHWHNSMESRHLCCSRVGNLSLFPEPIFLKQLYPLCLF